MDIKEILVVEDETSVFDLYNQIIGRCIHHDKFHLQNYDNGKDALDYISICKNPIDLMITGIKMNGQMSGIDLLKELNKNTNHKYLRPQRIYIVTADPLSIEGILNEEEHYDGILSKPFKIQDFEKILRESGFR